jgi:hypothetical protein
MKCLFITSYKGFLLGMRPPFNLSLTFHSIFFAFASFAIDQHDWQSTGSPFFRSSRIVHQYSVRKVFCMTYVITTVRAFEDIDMPHTNIYITADNPDCPSTSPPNDMAGCSGHSTRCFLSADIEWPAMSERSESNGDEGNRTLIPAMRPRCAPVTPRPQCCYAKTATYRGREYSSSAPALSAFYR